MDRKYESQVEDMLENYMSIKKAFAWEMDISKHLVAMNFTIQGKNANADEIKDLMKYMKQQTGMFSPFRGSMAFPIAGLLASDSNEPQNLLDEMLSYQEPMKSVGFKSSMYLPVALYAMTFRDESYNVTSLGNRAMDVYKEMKKNHPIVTSGDDYALAILIAQSGKNTDIMERYYQGLASEGFTKGNGLQALSHILSFSELDVNSTIRKCTKIYQTMKDNKLKVYGDYYAAIGLIALLEDTDGHLLNEFVELANFLRSQKKYKWLGKGVNVLFASALIASEYIKDIENGVMNTTLQVSIQTLIAAQQAAMIAAISCSAAAASAAN